MKLLEAIAATLTLVTIILVMRRSLWNFPVALVAVSATAIVLCEAKLYSDAGLQGFFFVLNLYGWWAWRQNKGKTGAVEVRRLPRAVFALWIAGAMTATLGWGRLMGATTDASAPYLDASIAMLSVTAQILMTQRRIENWHIWIVVNLISIALYASRGLYWFTALYLVLLILAIRGLAEWRNAEQCVTR